MTEPQLSPAGQQRHERMLVDLQSAMRQVHARRRLRRRVVVAVLPAIAVVAVAALWMRTTGPKQPSGSGQIVQQPVAPASASPLIVHVHTDSSIVERYRTTSTPRAVFMDDRTLLASLAELNVNAGLIKSEGRTWLTRDVSSHDEPTM